MNTNNSMNGDTSAIASIFLGIITWFSPGNIDLGIKILVGLGSIGTAIMAMRYYYFATKNNIKK